MTPRDTTETLIKICGLRDASSALHAATCGADFIGLNFVPASPRYVDRDTAATIANELRKQTQRCRSVGLFVDASVASMVEMVSSLKLDVLQLHGHEDVAVVAKAKRSLPPTTQLWRALPFDITQIDAWRNNRDIDALLIDAPYVSGELTGGTGRTLDWDALRSLDRDGLPPIMLAGGLTPDNVAEAIRVVRPWGVDVSSGVESSRGVKDLQKMKAFCDAVRNAE
ncbi:MAG: phosphoribosylanthranilate isomerase [Planctomycetota bacterium]